jgi:hypothetical protein
MVMVYGVFAGMLTKPQVYLTTVISLALFRGVTALPLPLPTAVTTLLVMTVLLVVTVLGGQHHCQLNILILRYRNLCGWKVYKLTPEPPGGKMDGQFV